MLQDTSVAIPLSNQPIRCANFYWLVSLLMQRLTIDDFEIAEWIRGISFCNFITSLDVLYHDYHLSIKLCKSECVS